MTIETALITAVSAVTSALVFVCGKLWQRSEDCESDRRALRDEIENVKERAGISQGRLTALESCPQNSCPFKRSANPLALALVAGGFLMLVIGCHRHPPTPEARPSADAGTEERIAPAGAPFPLIVTRHPRE